MGALRETVRTCDDPEPHVRPAGELPPLGEYHRVGTARDVPWSSLRRQILALLWRTRTPWGAYAIADALSAMATKKHPNSIYRSLKRLHAARLVIPIVSWSRYVISPDPGISTWCVILCSRCRAYSVAAAEDERRWLWSVARGFKFRPDDYAIECQGKCASCALLAE